MSTTYQLLPEPLGPSEETTLRPLLDITEHSMQYDITATVECTEGCGTITADFENLTANGVIDVALRLLNVVLYQYPEKMPGIVDRLQQLRY